MTWALVILAILVGLFLSGFFSGAETGLYQANRLRIDLGVHQRKRRAVRLSRVLSDETGALSVTLVGTNVSNYVTSLAVAFLFAELLGCSAMQSELYTVAVVTPVIFVFGEMVPKTLFQSHPNLLLGAGSGLLAISNRLFRMTGVIWLLTRIAHTISQLGSVASPGGDAFGPKRRVAMLLREALAHETALPDRSALIDRVCELSDTSLHEVMVPRNDVRMIQASAGRRELLRAARRGGHAYLPVYESSARHIIGTIEVDGLLQADGWESVGEQMQPPLSLGPHDTVAAAMAQMRQQRRNMAVVIDRGGQLLGIVMLKDLLREVVGDVAEGV